MTRFRPHLATSLASLLAATALCAASTATAASDETKQAEEAVRRALPTELTSLFPVGREFKGVAIPSYSGETLESVMRAETIVRVDERYLDLVDLVVTIHSGEAKTTITMDEAAYDLVTGRLTSKTPSRIEQPRFTMTGDRMIFETRSQLARLEGNVRVIVPDAEQFAPQFDSPLAGDDDSE